MLTGKNLIAGEPVDCADGRYTASGALAEFDEASSELINRALAAAERDAHAYRHLTAETRAGFLERIAEALERSGALLDAANVETALPPERLAGERGRTTNQLRMFANLLREGSWVDARIDRAAPDRKPVPKPDVRRLLVPIGPVAVFGASNFPLAFSVAGGDTASALAAGCPVVVKAHPAHPATSELAAHAILDAVRATGMPPGVFSLIHSTRPGIATALVQHPRTRAVAFTGSLRAGRALFNAAASRPDPIPVYAEMGSVNPVFLLPGALAERAEAIATGLKNSVTLGVGQFCTNPGITIGIGDDHFDRFVRRMRDLIPTTPPGQMLSSSIFESYEAAVERLSATTGVQTTRAPIGTGEQLMTARAAMLEVAADDFMRQRELREEVFGPSTVIVRCRGREDMDTIARQLEGQLTATIHGTPSDLAEYAPLIAILETKVGRLIVNGFPTGVEVCASMQHGGPYPATTDSRSTSVGTAAIHRFVRPVAYQDFPQSLLPLELQDANPRRIWRQVDGELTRDGF
jgi:2,5-dioxopentanoate dehydrogenase